jgi:hypothetical protein
VDREIGQPEVGLSAEQQLVLQAIYDHFRSHGNWPAFISIDRPLRREHGINTRITFNSLPDSLVVKPRQHMGPTDTDELTLRLSGIEACEGGRADTERFVRVVRWFAEREMAFVPPPGGDQEMPRASSEEVATYLGLDHTDPQDRAALERLYAMLRLDRWGLGSSGSNDNGWTIELAPDIWRFRKVQTIEDVITTRQQWIAEARAAVPAFRDPSPASSIIVNSEVRIDAPGTPRQGDSYVDQKITKAIEAKAGTSAFELTKLLRLIEELNDNCQVEHTYAAHAMLRAILDHIPPILGHPNFAAVTNNYSWSRSDRGYMQQLLNCKVQADDALHRQVSDKSCVLRFADLPPSVCINRLLQECADKL